MIDDASTTAIRRATRADCAVIHALFAALHTFNATLDPRFALGDDWRRVLDDHLEQMWAHGHGAALLSGDGTAVTGLLIVGGHRDSPLFRHRQWAEILALYVVPEARGRGIADQLVGAAVAWAQEHHYERIQLYVTAANHAARRCYRRTGFQPVQEIWRRELAAADGLAPADPWCDAAHDAGHDLLAMHTHLVSPDE
jgi:ribosomal protein S18 acetylase RimI-like enzyme